MAGNARKTYELYGLALLLVVCAWYVVLHDPVYRSGLQYVLSVGRSSPEYVFPDPSVYEAKDPQIGALFPTIGTGAKIRRETPPSGHGFLVAAIGDCESCTSLNLPKLYSQTKRRGITLLAFANGDANRVRQLAERRRRDGIEIPFYYDGDRKLAGALNSYYSGRLYFFTPEWRLRWRERGMHIDNYLFSTGRFDRIIQNTAP